LRRHWLRLQICFESTGLFASKLAPTKSSTPTKTVGASLLAKAMAQAPNMFWMYWPLREQARSHKIEYTNKNCGSKLACEGNGPGSKYVLDVLASSRASSLPQSRVHFTKLWEQACLRGQWPGLQICFGCTGLFASKLAPTKSSTPTKTVGASLLAKALVEAPNMFWMYWPLRERARSHRVVCISQNCGSKLACEGNGPGSNMFWMYWPLREQARSHRVVCISQNCGSKLACEGNGPGSRYVLDVLASSRASSLPQNRVHQQKLWEQACLRRQWSGFQICFGCTGLFASKLAPTESCAFHKTVGASLLARAMARAPNMFWMYWPLREQARSHKIEYTNKNCGSKLACEGTG